MKKLGLLALIITLCLMLFSCDKKMSDVAGQEFVLTKIEITYNDSATEEQKAAIKAEVDKVIGNVTLVFKEGNTFEMRTESETKTGTYLNSEEKVTLIDELGANMMIGQKGKTTLVFDQPAASLGLVGQIKKLQVTYEIK